MLGDRCLAADHLQGMLRHSEPVAQRADIGVGAGGFRRDRDAEQVARRGDGAGIGCGSFDRPADMAEQIDLIGHVQHILEQPGRFRPMPTQLQDFVRRRVAAIDAADLGLGGGIAPGIGGFEGGARDREIGLGGGEVGIGVESLGQVAVELLVLIEPPPIIGHGGRRLRRWLDRHQRRLGTVERWRRRIIRPDGTADQPDGYRRT